MMVGADVTEIRYGPDGDWPNWLTLDGDWYTDTVYMSFDVPTTDLPEGAYNTRITFYALNASGETIGTATLDVVLQVHEYVTFVDDYSQAYQHAYYGHSEHEWTHTRSVIGAGERWRASANVPWVRIADDVHDGSGTFSFVVDSAGMALGQHDATIRIENVDDPTDFDTILFRLYVGKPQLTLTTPPGFSIGGEDGTDYGPASFTFTLNTGANTYPWTARITTYNGMDWLLAEKTAGMVGGEGDSIAMDADRAALPRGSIHALVDITAVVLGVEIRTATYVQLNYEEDRIYVVENGVALYQFPSRSRIAGSLPVMNSQGRPDVPWTATTDASWLAVTPSGTTSDALTLSVTSDALAAEQLHVAKITIRSSDTRIENEESVHVSFWKSSADPAPLSVALPVAYAVANPALPYLHVLSAGKLHTYNVYNGAAAGPVDLPPAAYTGLSVSSDGQILFAPTQDDQGKGTIVELSDWTVREELNLQRAQVPLRIEGHQYLYRLPCCVPYAEFAALTPDARHAVSASNYYSGVGFEYGAIEQLDHSMLRFGPRIDSWAAFRAYDTGTVQAIAALADKRRALIATQAPNEVRVYDTTARERLWAAPLVGTPNNALVRTDGLLIVGTTVTDGGPDVSLYNVEGELLGQFAAASGDLLANQMALASDRHRIVMPGVTGIRIEELPALGPLLEPGS
jgi:hypothetical protein